MKMTVESAEWFQYWLSVYLIVDSPTPNYFASGKEDRAHWQFVVDALYMLLKSGLVEVWPSDYLIKDSEFSCDGIEGFCFQLACQNPYRLEELDKPPAAWLSPSIVITKEGRDMVNFHFDIADCKNNLHPLNEKFLENLESVFEKNGFLKSSSSLFPIVLNKYGK